MKFPFNVSLNTSLTYLSIYGVASEKQLLKF